MTRTQRILLQTTIVDTADDWPDPSRPFVFKDYLHNVARWLAPGAGRGPDGTATSAASAPGARTAG